MSEELKPCPVTRWDAINDGMADDPIEFMECEDGDWVQYEDAALLERERDEAQRVVDEIKGIIGPPAPADLRRHGLSDSIPDRVRYHHREWLDQTHAAQQRVLKEQGLADAAQRDLAAARAEIARLNALVKAQAEAKGE